MKSRVSALLTVEKTPHVLRFQRIGKNKAQYIGKIGIRKNQQTERVDVVILISMLRRLKKSPCDSSSSAEGLASRFSVALLETSSH